MTIGVNFVSESDFTVLTKPSLRTGFQYTVFYTLSTTIRANYLFNINHPPIYVFI